MAEISAQLVKTLRDMTDAGFMECKKALVEAEGDLDRAVDVLRTRGQAKAVKKADRATNEGTVAAFVSEDKKLGALLELNCETDFVGTNATFVGFAKKLAELVAQNNPATIEDFMQLVVDGETVQDMLTEKISTIGENMKVARFERIQIEGEGALDSYVHLGGKIGILTEFSFAQAATAQAEEFTTMAHDLSLQVAAARPICCTREDVPAEVTAHELKIYKAQAAESGKPEEIQQKMAEGRLNKFFAESVLCEQAFIKDNDMSVNDYVAKTAKALSDTIEVKRFIRLELGENE